jgi:hypothetical protein
VTVAEETPGVYSCQIIQTEPLKLRVRLAVKELREEHIVWEALQTRLVTYLAEQGIAQVVIEKAPESPQLNPKSGKFRQVWSDVLTVTSVVPAESERASPQGASRSNSPSVRAGSFPPTM